MPNGVHRAQHLPSEHPVPSCEGIKTFCAWKMRSVCESEDGLVLGGCNLPLSPPF